ncbi:MAG: methylmalonyl-CoA epimerase [Rhodococcus sp.]|nr:methylmalonyl-CoA epimerase [Rhodococcus sp. (in: high G+C Gram-positive bacteria)]
MTQSFPESQSQSSPETRTSPLSSDLVLAIDHVGIAVPDLDAAIAWYSQHLGMEATHEEVNEEQGVREAMLSVVGTTSDSTALQLLAPLNEKSTIAKFIDRSGPGLQQLAYRVSDIDAMSALLRDQGVRLLYDAPRRGTADSRINFVHPKDAGGVLVELVEQSSGN